MQKRITKQIKESKYPTGRTGSKIANKSRNKAQASLQEEKMNTQDEIQEVRHTGWKRR
jgi:hypothetical protein